MNILESKKQIYNEMKFTLEEISRGESIYNSLTTTQKEQFVNIYPNSFYGQSKDGYWVLDKPSKLTNEVKVAIINFAAHEPTSDVTLDPKVELARHLFHSFNSIPVQGPQELYGINCWWLDIESNDRVKGALVTSLVDFTTVNAEAKREILNLIPKDAAIIESLNFWLAHNFPRNYDYDFGQQVKQEIDKYFLSRVSIRPNIESETESKSPHKVNELLESLNKRGFKVSFDYEIIENPDPREGGGFQQPVIYFGEKRIFVWSKQILFNEDASLLCFLSESDAVRWGVEVTIANTNSLQIVSIPIEFCYEGEASVVRSNKSFFYVRVKTKLLSVDISDFPELKISYD